MNESFLPYLNELRKRLLYFVMIFFISIGVSFYFANSILKVLTIPLTKYLPPNTPLIFTGIADKFIILFKISISFGLIIAFPYLLFQVWQFIKSALKPEERKPLIKILFSSIFLFIFGIHMGYFIIIPQGISFLLSIGGNIASPMITLKDFVNFSISLLLICGLLFQLPLLLNLLIKLNFLSIELLKRKRAHVFFILAILSAVLTPSQDLLTMFLLLIPLYVLFELSLLFTK